MSCFNSVKDCGERNVIFKRGFATMPTLGWQFGDRR